MGKYSVLLFTQGNETLAVNLQYAGIITSTTVLELMTCVRITPIITGIKRWRVSQGNAGNISLTQARVTINGEVVNCRSYYAKAQGMSWTPTYDFRGVRVSACSWELPSGDLQLPSERMRQ